MKIAVMGYGTIGSGVVDVLRINEDKITERAGEEIEVKYILDLRDFPGDPMENAIVHDYQVIFNDPEIGVVVETMGGVEPAYTFVKAMLEAGKQVATSNKNLVAAKGAELIKIARDHNVNFQFEASVGGGIPIIRPLNKCLTADEIEEITGILNGTTNYMLTKMSREGLNYDDVLKEAQAKGYAELHPEADVEGWDACRKIAILTSLAYGKNVDFADLYVEGITQITRMDFAYAKKLGTTIKLFAKSQCIDGKYYAMVAPFMVTADNPLYAVQNVFNAILVHGNMVGDTMYYGKGAGKLATASAVVADVIDCAKHLGKHVQVIWEEDKLEISPMDDFTRRFFVRVKGTDRAQITDNFGEVEFIDSVAEEETGFITSEMTEKAYEECAKKAGNVINRIRFEN